MTGAAIAGLGITELGKVYGRSSASLAAEAVRLAAADAGLALPDLDGLLVSSGIRQDVGVSMAGASRARAARAGQRVRCHRGRDGDAGGPGDRERRRDGGGLRLRGHAAAAAAAGRRGVGCAPRRRPDSPRPGGLEPGLRCGQPEHLLRAVRAAAHGAVRHDVGSARRDRRRPAGAGGGQPARGDADAAHPGGAHLHGPGDAGRLRVLPEGRGRPVRRRRAARAGREARLQHRRGAAVGVLHVGDDTAVRGRHPGPGRRRGAAGPAPRRDPRQRQRRAPRASRHPGAQPAPGPPERRLETGPDAGRDAFPAVARDEASAEFFAAAARGELLVQRCPESGDVLGPQARTCPSCGSAGLVPVVASGRGTLVSWAVVHQAPVPSLAAAVPYLTAVVELAEGPWLVVRLVGSKDSDDRELRAGLPLVACFLPSGAAGDEPPGEVLPAFTPLAQATP